MESNSGFAHACGWTKANYYFLGMWPQVNSNGIRRYCPLIHAILCLIFLLLPRITALFFFWHEKDALIQSFSTLIALFFGCVKLLVLHFQQKVFGDFLNKMETEWALPMTKKQYKAVMRFTIIGRRISIVSIVIGYLTIGIGVVAQKVYNLERFYIKDPDPRLSLNLFWIVYLPYDTSKTINFVVSLVLQFYSSCLSAITYFTFNTLIAVMIFHICGQLELIKMSICQLGNYSRSEKKISFQNELKRIVEKHVELIRLAENIEGACNFVYLLALLAFTLTICLVGYTIINALNTGEVNYIPISFGVSIVCCAGTQFFFICWACNFLTTQSTAVGRAVYNSNWTELMPSESRALMLIGFKIFRPLGLTTGKFAILSQSLFLQAIKTSMSFLSVLLAAQTSDI